MSRPENWGSAFRDAKTDSTRVYDEIIRPMFQPFTLDIVERGAPAAGSDVVDIACGPGTVTRHLARRVGRSGSVVGADISPAMLAVATSSPDEEDAAPIRWIESPAAPLGLPDASTDLLTCQQGLQFFPDQTAALAEARRVLRPGGRALFSFWATVDRCRPFAAMHAALQEVLGSEVAERYAAGPWALDGRDAERMARDAGFGDVEVTTLTLETALPDDPASEIVRSLKGTALAAETDALDDVTRKELIAATQRELDRIHGPGATVTTLTTWLLSCRS